MKEVKRAAKSFRTSEDLRGELGTDAAACVVRAVESVMRPVVCVASAVRLVASVVV